MIVRLAAETVTGLGERKRLENFMAIHHTCVCPYTFSIPMRVFGPQAAHPSQGRQEGIFPALEPRVVSQQGLRPVGSLYHPIALSISRQADQSTYYELSTAPSPLAPLDARPGCRRESPMKAA